MWAECGQWRDRLAKVNSKRSNVLAPRYIGIFVRYSETDTIVMWTARWLGIIAANLAYPQVQAANEYSLVQEAESNCEEDIEHNRKAYDLLFRFETQVRKFIDEEMTAAFGPGWEKHRVSGGTHKEWRQKWTNNKGDSGQALISYADFTDYLPIIVRSDNWDQVFKTTFERKESVRESFQRLYPIRLDTMYA